MCELYGSDLSDSKTKLIKDSDWDYKESEKDPLNLGPVCNEKTRCNTEWGRCRNICEDPGLICICEEKNAGMKYGSDCALNIAYMKSAERIGKTPDYASLAVDGDLTTFSNFDIRLVVCGLWGGVCNRSDQTVYIWELP